MQRHIRKDKQLAAKAKKASKDAKKAGKAAPSANHAHDLRTALAWLKSQGDLIETKKVVDPDLEVTGLQKHMDGGCPVMFHNVKGKPNHRVITNLFGDMNVINKMFGWKSDAERVRKLAEALRKPLKPVEISQDEAPVQEHVVLKPKDVNKWAATRSGSPARCSARRSGWSRRAPSMRWRSPTPSWCSKAMSIRAIVVSRRRNRKTPAFRAASISIRNGRATWVRPIRRRLSTSPR
jgi:hypothetical protein